MSFVTKIFGDANKRIVDRHRAAVKRINELEHQFESLSDEELRQTSDGLRKRLAGGETLEDILPEAFAAVREAAKRALGQRHYDVQMIGGIVLHNSGIAEMKTGEGKTLVATLPAYLNALAGQGVHVITVNDYLSRRDAVWMGRVYFALGMTTGCLNHEASYIFDPAHKKIEEGVADTRETFLVEHEFLKPVERRQAYEADITYGTNNEYGFDYLRDNMAYNLSDIVQAKGHHFAIVDEVDSILIDEARTPLIISAPDEDSGKLYQTFARVVPGLVENEDYNRDEKLRTVSIAEAGIEKVEKKLGIQNIYEEGGTRYVHHLEQALKAQVLYSRDKDYVVKEGEVIIVDEFTGRLMPGRRWSEGLHQAVEAKENVLVQKESKTLATITFQNYFRLYQKLAGMTGTAQTSAEEFYKVYKLEVVTVPTNRVLVRKELPDRIYKTENGKVRAIIREIKERHQTGQPILIGTVSISKNEMLATYLKREGIPYQVLNAKNHEQEGAIIAQAGRLGAVTVATNMAGRGVDIILGGNPPTPEEAGKVREAGGLHVIGTERHEARRIDNQLRGRAGRQGDPGSSQFFVSTEDEVVRIFGGDRLRRIMDTLGVSEDDVIENSFVSRAIEQAQSKIEGHNFDIRKHVLEYDDVMNKHRTAVYKLRNETLGSENVQDRVWSYVMGTLTSIVHFHTGASEGDWNGKEIGESLSALTGLKPDAAFIEEKAQIQDRQAIEEYVLAQAKLAYENREKELTVPTMRYLEKALVLRVIDELWVDHLEQMEYLRDSVRLRAYGQRDPLVEYKIEGQQMFARLEQAIGGQIANLIFKVGIATPANRGATIESRPQFEVKSSAGDVSRQMQQESQRQQPVSSSPNIGRNDPCPCGAINPATGQVYKYKKCGLINAPYHKKK